MMTVEDLGQTTSSALSVAMIIRPSLVSAILHCSTLSQPSTGILRPAHHLLGAELRGPAGSVLVVASVERSFVPVHDHTVPGLGDPGQSADGLG